VREGTELDGDSSAPGEVVRPQTTVELGEVLLTRFVVPSIVRTWAHGVYQPRGKVLIRRDPPPMVDGRSPRDVELDDHFIGLFREHLEETRVHELVDLGWYGVALADLAHWWGSRPDGKQSVEANGGGRRNSIWNYTSRRPAREAPTILEKHDQGREGGQRPCDHGARRTERNTAARRLSCDRCTCRLQ
jgi:hypothetical protein